MLCAGLGVRAPRIVTVPGRAIEAAARGIDGLARRIPGVDLPGLTRSARLARTDNPYDSSRARAELGWSDVVPVEEAIQRTAAWLTATHTDQTTP
jgi:nucleoside-diphosphate-sugar epimerase